MVELRIADVSGNMHFSKELLPRRQRWISFCMQRCFAFNGIAIVGI